ncbi:hypothetical protein [Lelliottia wanjuensis]|uniref:hypothetical protein n=1 Tax=Lelliottia wanjuensis TaxID=3050585 RepID=UPI00254C5480|nr:hypothetical protein [Lelliottia sp. V86_10]MDK9583175.1 hypothetical protein [Lelliottia sp. V86_10]
MTIIFRILLAIVTPLFLTILKVEGSINASWVEIYMMFACSFSIFLLIGICNGVWDCSLVLRGISDQLHERNKSHDEEFYLLSQIKDASCSISAEIGEIKDVSRSVDEFLLPSLEERKRIRKGRAEYEIESKIINTMMGKGN